MEFTRSGGILIGLAGTLESSNGSHIPPPDVTYRLLLLFCVASASASAQSADSTNYAVTTTGDTLRTAVELKSPLFGRDYVEIDGRQWQIESFRFLHLDGSTNAIVDGRRLAPLMTEGRIRVFAHPSSSGAPIGMIPGGMGPNGNPMPMGVGGGGLPQPSNRVGYFQLENGPVLKATPPALRDAIGHYEPSARYLRRSQTLRVGGLVLTGAGIATFLTGAFLSFRSEDNNGDIPPYAPAMAVGVVSAAAGAFLLPDMSKSMRNKAIDAYNAD